MGDPNTEAGRTLPHTQLHREMETLEQISHIPLVIAWLIAVGIWCTYNSTKYDWEKDWLAISVLLMVTAIGCSIAMHEDMADDGHVDYTLGLAEYWFVGLAIVSLVLQIVRRWLKLGWTKVRSDPLCQCFFILALCSIAVAVGHFVKGNAYWRAHKEAASLEDYELYNLWHIQFHVYGGYAAMFVLLFYGALVKLSKRAAT